MMTKHGLEFMTMIIHPWLSEPTKQSYPLYESFLSPPLGPDDPISSILHHIAPCSPKNNALSDQPLSCAVIGS